MTMCTTCGCSDGHVIIDGHAHHHHHHHEHRHDEAHHHGDLDGRDHVNGRGNDDGRQRHAHPDGDGSEHVHEAPAPRRRVLDVERDVLAENAAHAARNREWLRERGILALNVVSSPGAGKTTLLARTVRALAARETVCVIEGDQSTSRDAERIRAAGARAVQINTGKGCHLDAHMVSHALQSLDPPPGALVLIENVGNLVCPALFDLGEAHKVLVFSVTEGEDKPLKYPHMFRSASLLLLNKVDLEPHLRFDTARCLGYARQINPGVAVRRVSATHGTGIDGWLDWIRTERAALEARLGRGGRAPHGPGRAAPAAAAPSS